MIHFSYIGLAGILLKLSGMPILISGFVALIIHLLVFAFVGKLLRDDILDGYWGGKIGYFFCWFLVICATSYISFSIFHGGIYGKILNFIF